MMALSVYAETLNATEASRATGIPRTTIRQWIEAEDSDLILDELRHAIRATCGHKYAQIALKAANELIERLDNGDEVLLANGEYARRKVSARDLITITSMAADRHALVTGTSALHGKANQALNLIVDKLAQAMQANRAPNKEADQAQLPVDNAK